MKQREIKKTAEDGVVDANCEKRNKVLEDRLIIREILLVCSICVVEDACWSTTLGVLDNPSFSFELVGMRGRPLSDWPNLRSADHPAHTRSEKQR